eukprot:scaffold3376_cov151-Amphora_coffeaeformis.AAC.5
MAKEEMGKHGRNSVFRETLPLPYLLQLDNLVRMYQVYHTPYNNNTMSRAEPSRAEPSRAEPSRAEPSRNW